MVEGGGSEVVLEIELKAVQGPSYEKRSVGELGMILRVNRVLIQMRNFLNASHSRMMRLQRGKKGPHHEELQTR